MSEHTVAIVDFEGALKREMKRLRIQLAKCDKLSEMKLTITISGRLGDGDLNLEYTLCERDYTAPKVEGANLSEVAIEFLRRKGWDELNAPKAIGYHKIPTDETEEVPF